MSVLSVNRASNVMCDCSAGYGMVFGQIAELPLIRAAGVNGLPCNPSVNNNLAEVNNSIKNQDADVNNIVAMLKSFLSQISTLLAGWKENKPVTVDVVPDSVSPKVNPTPVVPKPETSPAHISELSNKRNGAKADDIWGGFRQGPDGNCVTVSAIKAAMHKFGQSPTDIYKSVSETARGYDVTMRDGFNLTLTKPELAQASAGARFVGRDRGMLKDAQFLFAVSCKRAQIENNDGKAARSFSAAIQTLNNGEDEWGGGEGFLRLGLKKHMKKVPVSTLANGQVGMVNRARHSVAIIDGKEELWGSKGKAPRYGDAVALIG
ncbi:hypothetical protein [Pseudomonas brenneri]|uniref:Type III secretion system effector protein n=2 Tax=Pseudomonas brenneri TaxID=129817 RepID=A0ABY0WB92_9PSED|nr:hypothetical protein [Pseudomonas brenneri]SDU86961.1 hypothetical protein SAMN04490181_0792 [Pseudomonas brenneri]